MQHFTYTANCHKRPCLSIFKCELSLVRYCAHIAEAQSLATVYLLLAAADRGPAAGQCQGES